MEDRGTATLPHRARRDLGASPIREAVTHRGKQLRGGDTTATARLLFENPSVQVLPVLDGARYIGAVDRDLLAGDLHHDVPVGPLAAPLLATVTASTPAAEALALLDVEGGSRLVVLGEDDATYVGIVCLRSDRQHLCLEAECHEGDRDPSSRKEA